MLSDAIICLVIQIAFGLFGAFIVGNLSKYRLSILGMSIAGIVGGGLGGQLLGLIWSGDSSLAVGGGFGKHLMALLRGGSEVTAANAVRGGLDASGILAQIAGGIIGGAVLVLLLSISRQTSDD